MVGILDPFWESKGFLTAEEFRRMCDDTVILARFPRYVYAAGETLKVSLEVYRYAESDLCGTLEYAVSDGENVLVSGAFSVNAENNANTFVGEIVCPLEIGKSAKLTVSARIGEISNSWDVWAYRADETRYENVLVATKLNEAVFKTLREGGKVLFLAKDVPNCLQTTFNPPVWTFTMFSRHSCGWLIDAKHPALEGFPTEMYADMQWEDLTLGSRALPLAKLHKKTEPIVSAIDDPVRAQHGEPALRENARIHAAHPHQGVQKRRRLPDDEIRRRLADKVAERYPRCRCDITVDRGYAAMPHPEPPRG